jgi:hypothetical protein
VVGGGGGGGGGGYDMFCNNYCSADVVLSC